MTTGSEASADPRELPVGARRAPPATLPAVERPHSVVAEATQPTNVHECPEYFRNIVMPGTQEPVPAAPASKLQTLWSLRPEIRPKDFIISSYRIVGFVVLAGILFGLGSYLSVHLFYLLNHSWVAPVILSPTDERVLTLVSHYARESGQRDLLVAQKLELETQRRQAERTLANEQAFQESYTKAIEEDLATNAKELARFKRLQNSFRSAKYRISNASGSFGKMSKQQLKRDYEARLIDREQKIQGEYQLAKIAETKLALKREQVELDARVAALRRQVSSLGAVAASNKEEKPQEGYSYDVLRIKREFERSVVSAQQAQDQRDTIESAIAMLDKTIATYEESLNAMQASPYMLAANDTVVVAFSPYDNLDAVNEGLPVYACRFSFFWCNEVGTVASSFEGEFNQQHPTLRHELRGVMIALELTDLRGAEADVLHLGRKPLWL